MASKYDWQSKIRANLLSLHVFGLWPTGNTYTFLYSVYAVVILTTFEISHIVFQAMNIYFIYDNLMAMTGTIYVLLIEMLAVFKCYCVITNMKILKQLMEILDTDMFQPKNSRQRAAIKENIRTWKIIYKAFLYSCFVVNVFWMIPLMGQSAVEKRRLPFNAWYPFDISVSPFYEITYIYQILCQNFIIVIDVSLGAFVAALNIFNACQFDILSDNLRNLHRNKNVNKNFIYCVQHHLEILSFAGQTNKFLNLISIIQFAVSAVSIGLTMFQMTLVIPMSIEFFAFISYGGAITLQIFMFCFSGNEVEVKSSNVPYAIFESEWYDFPQEVKKHLLFFTMKAQKPVRLSAFNLFYLSLETFVNIMKTSYSYFALLQNVSS